MLFESRSLHNLQERLVALSAYYFNHSPNHSAIIFISCLFTRYLAIICQFFFYRTPRYGARLCRQHKLNLAGSVLVFQFCVVLNLAFIKEGMGDTLRRVAKYKQTMTSVQREIRVCPEVWYIGDPTLYEQN